MSGDQKNIAGAMPPHDDVLGVKRSDAPGTVGLHMEELAVARASVETGRVRVHVVTHEHEEFVDVPLSRSSIEVERVAINRVIDAIPPIRQEGNTTIVPVVHEILVLERRLILKEELHVRCVNVTEHHQERVILRHQEAVITQIPAQKPDTGPQGE